MAVNLVLPSLSSWATSRLTGLLQSKTQEDFNTTFDATFAADANFTVNNKPIARNAYKAQLLAESAANPFERSMVVQIEGQTEVQTGNQGQLSGVVGIFYTALSDSRFLVLGAPSESRATSSLNLVIEPTEKYPPNPLHVHGYFDPRRVTAVNQVVSEATYHVTIPQASVPKVTTQDNSKVELGPGPIQLPPDFQGPFGGRFGPGPVRLPPGPFGGHFGPGPVRLPPGESGAKPETLPGFGIFGAGPVIAPGETLGESASG